MKRIGLLGCDSTLLCQTYERHIVREVGLRYGGAVIPNFVTVNLHTNLMSASVGGGTNSGAGKILNAGVGALQGLGAQTVVLCTSRAQSEFEITASDGPIQLMADVVVAAVSRFGCRRIGLMGASHDAEERFWRGRFKSAGNCEPFFPVPADRDHVNRLINEELSRGIVNESSRTDVLRVAYELREAGTRAFVLLRPELGLVFDAAENVLPIFDATELHAVAAVDWSFGKSAQVPPSPGPQPTERNTPRIEK
jgi:aspartate racemase